MTRKGAAVRGGWLWMMLVLPGIAFAGPKPKGSEAVVDPLLEEAKRHFQQAVALFNEGNYPVALTEFEAAYKVRPSAVFLYNIALTQKRLFRYSEALKTIERYLAEEKKVSPERRAEVDQLVTEMKSLLAEVRLSITPAGAEVAVDGRRVGAAPLERLELVAGAHSIEITAEGYEGLKREISVIAGLPVALTLALKAIPKTGRVRVTSSVLKSQVSIDGKPLGEAPVEVELGIGGHQLVVSSPGYTRYQGEIAIVGGERREVPITLDELVVERKKPLYKQWWPWTIGAVLLGGVVATSVAVPLSNRRAEPIGGTFGPAIDVRP